MPRPVGGSSLALSFEPTSARPSTRRMNGFHEGYESNLDQHLPHRFGRRFDVDLGPNLPPHSSLPLRHRSLPSTKRAVTEPTLGEHASGRHRPPDPRRKKGGAEAPPSSGPLLVRTSVHVTAAGGGGRRLLLFRLLRNGALRRDEGPAIEAAFWSADLVTFAGSKMPDLTMSTHSRVAALIPGCRPRSGSAR